MDTRLFWKGSNALSGDLCIAVTEKVAANCRETPERAGWLERLPKTVKELAARWELTLGEPFAGDEISCAWVAPVTRSNGERAVLKLAMPHMEGEHEIAGMRFWNGDPTARLLDADEGLGALLLERCEPGTILRTRPEPEQDVVIAGLLRRLWRMPAAPHPFRPLAEMTEAWSRETLAAEPSFGEAATGAIGASGEPTSGQAARQPDPGMVREGLRLFAELSRSAPKEALLATDLHAGNVVQAHREPWLVIDPKPFVGDVTYDATQHLLNCTDRLLADPDGLIRRFSDLLEVDCARVRLWMFARATAELRADWDGNEKMGQLARALAP